MHRAEEDYLKEIYKLTIEEDLEIVKTSDLAFVIGSTDQTINEMVKRLASKKMVNFIRYKGVKLTSKGLVEAKRLVRNHRLWEVFLVNKLNYTWDLVHDEAEKLEHASSTHLMNQIDEFLGHPTHCVHGNAIPMVDGFVPNTCKTSLKEFEIGSTLTVKRVSDKLNFLHFMQENNISLETQIKILDKDDFNGIIKTLINNEEKTLSFVIADGIFVEQE